MEVRKTKPEDVFLSTPSARRATDVKCAIIRVSRISIHALREEGDPCRNSARYAPFISIHALREEGDADTFCWPQRTSAFLSTPSARRATFQCNFSTPPTAYFYPRPPRGGRREQAAAMGKACAISIHALREEGDGRPRAAHTQNDNFYPRPPRGGRRFVAVGGTSDGVISIHALREEGDNSRSVRRDIVCNFYPRPPRGGRPESPCVAFCVFNFYPRPPRGGRRAMWSSGRTSPRFLSTPSARRATCGHLVTLLISLNFYPRPPRGGRRHSTTSPSPKTAYFYPRPPRGGRQGIA